MNSLRSAGKSSFKDSHRAVRDTLNCVGDRWTIYVVRALHEYYLPLLGVPQPQLQAA